MTAAPANTSCALVVLRFVGSSSVSLGNHGLEQQLSFNICPLIELPWLGNHFLFRSTGHF